ncbi:hypothetical protein PhCBS80983_g06209 [Powellomyces hirtus]|uniref:ATPase of the ABC class n=1 Tax=Powellomyces hirtus TaxID=109895 RepID=A0A507DS74_9FUNG|nr:hypothetical protein PhCBS80983_g06209 [Powellomyces hirtus]
MSRTPYDRGAGGGNRGTGGGGRGGGRGRGAYYREKYGGKRGGTSVRVGAGGGGDGAGGRSGNTTDSENIGILARSGGALADMLRGLERAPYAAYKDLKRAYYEFEDGNILLFVDHVQADPYAAPSKIRVRLSQSLAGFPLSLFSTRTRRAATEDYVTRRIAEHVMHRSLNVANAGGGGWHGSKGADIHIDTPGQQVLERTSVSMTSEYIEARLTINLPAQGRSILGMQAAQLLTVTIPGLAQQTLRCNAFPDSELFRFVQSVEDQAALRDMLDDAGLLAFVANGAVLPRETGAKDTPLCGPHVVPFKSPPSLEVTLTCPNRGVVTGMGVPKGITLIVGGGFHGKSTLLDALQLGVYNHIPGDGREFVVTQANVMKINAEDGRSVASVDISPFISNLPFGKDTTTWSTSDASGSTSMAANMQEALEIGCSGFLLDEDTCANNLLFQDERMAVLVGKCNEPITPLISKVRSLYSDKKCSAILVTGGSGSYMDVADLVISMVAYVPSDVTSKARRVAQTYPSGLNLEHLPYGSITPRIPLIPTAGQGSCGRQEVIAATTPRKSKALNAHRISIDGTDVDLSGLEQLVHGSQARAIVAAILHVRDHVQDGTLSLAECVGAVNAMWDHGERGLLETSATGWIVGDLARPRMLELAGAINRLRGLSVRNLHGG